MTIHVSLLGMSIVMLAASVPCVIVVGAWLIPAPKRTDPRPIDIQLDRPTLIYRPDRPEVITGQHRRPIGQQLAGRLQRDEAMEKLAGQAADAIDRAATLQAYAVELAQQVVALGGSVPALPRRAAVLDETEAGVR